MLACWLMLVMPLLHHAVKSELICSSNTIEWEDWAGCEVPDQDCRVTRPVCPEKARLDINDPLTKRSVTTGIGCSYPSSLEPKHYSNSIEQLTLTPVIHNCAEYNLTVSWTSNTTIPVGSTYELKLFRQTILRRRTCLSNEQSVDGLPEWRQISFDGLIFDAEDDLVELTVLAPNGSELLVIHTGLPPQPLNDYSSYRCLHNEDYTYPVTNVSHTLICEEDQCNLTILWKPPTPVQRYNLPVTYFVSIFANSSDSPIAVFSTNQTQMVIRYLNSTRDYFIKVEPLIPCSTSCGNSSTVTTLLSVPITTPSKGATTPGVQYNNTTTAPEVQTTVDQYNSSTTAPGIQTTVNPVTTKSAIDIVKIGAGTVAAGGLVALVVLLCIFLIGVLVIKRRREKKKEIQVVKSGFSNPESITQSPHMNSFSPSMTGSTQTISLPGNEVPVHHNGSSLSASSVTLALNKIEALIVVSERCKNKELLETLNFISRYKFNDAYVSLSFMGDETNHGMIASDVLECALKRSSELFLLCVVNKEFLEEWEGNGSNNSLVYCVQVYLKGKMHYSEKISRIVVLTQQEDDSTFIPFNLKTYKSYCIEDAENISRCITRQPEYKLL